MITTKIDCITTRKHEWTVWKFGLGISLIVLDLGIWIPYRIQRLTWEQVEEEIRATEMFLDEYASRLRNSDGAGVHESPVQDSGNP